MKKFISQDDIIDELHKKTEFYKKDLRTIIDSLEEVIMELMVDTVEGQPSEIRLFHGWKLGAKVLPERESKNPKTGEMIVTPEKISPYCSFEQSFKKKLNNM